MNVFGHTVPRHVLTLAGLEAVVLLLCLYLAFLLQPELWSVEGVARFQVEMAVVAAAGVFLMLLFGLYDPEQIGMNQGLLMVALRLAVALLILGGVMWVALRAFPQLAVASHAVALGLGLAFVGLLAKRSIYREIVRVTARNRRVLVLGAGSRAATVLEPLADGGTGALPYRVVGFVAGSAVGSVAVDEGRLLRLAPGQRLLDLAIAHGANEVVVAVRDRRGGQLPIKELLDCKLYGLGVTDLSTFLERERRRLYLDSLNTSWLVFGRGFRQGWGRATIKRGFDLVASSLLLLVTLPVMLVTAVAIRLDSRGPVFYRQERVGHRGQVFQVYKFRSMRPDAEGDGVARWARADDDRVTRVGRLIRTLRIDELPQIYNVLRGDMSFVGPRPERPSFVEQLSEQIPYFPARQSIRPGITGWAQVCYPYGASVEDAREKLQYDLYYLKNHSLFLDLVILIETVRVVLFGRGAR
ncbi:MULTISPECIES: TIGR03013 family XrtA/PEP-CTERM system glycosyltransferase [unclassified Halorhodospira]|uniref:TIGR03013 family XrtA/PEP-CTERM system glycosyltransferase n=1 Tax=unclassified Halorhodospira TaxID=2626748 RepID=UPI001EE93C98|nr:TIGR03013 family PEP-CTERM/XrtA system glycosyltransferase [Halorhodospira sp. 9622]MCG5540170.1 TIGR03013 family PEP-CTERM/XrtA system glycosyltransferase [Halorhodospira sp. M39old]MCG5545129.1 TIGR03013 family PEP-CTERM/XrtA system glycosyltransferase [Halorhodospira sp. M38]